MKPLKRLFSRIFSKQYQCIVCDTRYYWNRSVIPINYTPPMKYVCANNFNCWKVFAAAVEFGYIDIYIDPPALITP